MSTNHIYLTLRSGGDEMKVEGEPELVGRFFKAAYPEGFEVLERGMVEDASQPARSPVAAFNGGTDDWQKRLIAFIRQIDPQNDVEGVAAITYFFQKQAGEESMSLETYEQAYDALQRVPIEAPANIKSSVRNLVDRTKYLRNAGRGLYTLTMAGEEYVENLIAERGVGT
jgi:hypothetical protein